MRTPPFFSLDGWWEGILDQKGSTCKFQRAEQVYTTVSTSGGIGAGFLPRWPAIASHVFFCLPNLSLVKIVMSCPRSQRPRRQRSCPRNRRTQLGNCFPTPSIVCQASVFALAVLSSSSVLFAATSQNGTSGTWSQCCPRTRLAKSLILWESGALMELSSGSVNALRYTGQIPTDASRRQLSGVGL